MPEHCPYEEDGGHVWFRVESNPGGSSVEQTELPKGYLRVEAKKH